MVERRFAVGEGCADRIAAGCINDPVYEALNKDFGVLRAPSKTVETGLWVGLDGAHGLDAHHAVDVIRGPHL